ncbi:hypothetical protein D7D25_05180 [Proteiniphilum sp. X52]|nr:hypothetical protein D7D25_05180 [Proteiniphilum sp. X52]
MIFSFCLIFSVSCTYDYFEDETNYVIYVPKANAELITDEYRIEDIHIYIYNSETLEKQKSASFPFQENARMKLGNFNFRLFPGSYSTYCFANTGEINFHQMASRQDATFGLPESDNMEYRYPGSLPRFSVEITNPKINYPGPLVVDTAYFNKRYSGRICVAFKKLTKINPLLSYSNIKNVKIAATGTGTYQRMSLLTDSVHTRSSSYTSSDKVIMDCIPYENPYEDYSFGIDGYFFPSLSDAEGLPISLTMDFIDHNGNSIQVVYMDVTETLHMNQTIYVGTDGFTTMVLNISDPEQWNSEIVSGGNQSGGDEGMGV